jgi:hypothetical protein
VVRADIAEPGHTLQASAGETVMSDDRPDTLRGAIKDGMEADGHFVRLATRRTV